MDHRMRGVRTLGVLLVAAVACVAIAACGSSNNSGQAGSLLKQTFAGGHSVKSGVLWLKLLVGRFCSHLTSPVFLSKAIRRENFG